MQQERKLLCQYESTLRHRWKAPTFFCSAESSSPQVTFAQYFKRRRVSGNVNKIARKAYAPSQYGDICGLWTWYNTSKMKQWTAKSRLHHLSRLLWCVNTNIPHTYSVCTISHTMLTETTVSSAQSLSAAAAYCCWSLQKENAKACYHAFLVCSPYVKICDYSPPHFPWTPTLAAFSYAA